MISLAKRGSSSVVVALALALGTALAGLSCNKSDNGGGGGSGSNSAQVQLVGGGSSFDNPILTQWFNSYHEKHSNVTIEYQSIGSGAGTKQFTTGTFDFAASDAVSDEDVKGVKGGVVVFPVTAGAVVVIYNLPEVSDLKLSREALPNIFLGKIKKWNDPAIASANPGVTLPDKDINVVRRADASGTTAIFTTHLAAISPEWKSGPGAGKSVNWPVGVGGPQNDGVTAQVKQTPGSIGYVEYGYATQNKLPMAQLQNKAGKFVKPGPDTAAKALASAQLPEDLRASVPDPEGDDSYPIVSYSWVLAHPKYDDADKAKTLKDVFDYGLTEGQKVADQLGYVPLPDNVAQKSKAAVDGIKAGG